MAVELGPGINLGSLESSAPGELRPRESSVPARFTESHGPWRLKYGCHPKVSYHICWCQRMDSLLHCRAISTEPIKCAAGGVGG